MSSQILEFLLLPGIVPSTEVTEVNKEDNTPALRRFVFKCPQAD